MPSLDETRAAIRAVLPRIEVRRWPWKISAHATAGGSEVLFISENVPERDSGQTTTLGGMSYGLPPSLDVDALLGWIYAQLRRHVLHELAEAVHVDGKRVFDPHGDEAAEFDGFEDAMQESPPLDEYADKVWEKPKVPKMPAAHEGAYLSADDLARLAR